MNATLKQWGSSVGVVIPSRIVRRLGLHAEATVDIIEQDDSVIIRKTGRRPRRPIGEIVKQLTPREPLPGWDDAPPVGKEVW